MKTTTFIFIICISLIASCSKQKGTEQNEVLSEEVEKDKKAQTPTTTSLWETDTLLTTSESVLYHQASDILFVACMNGAPLEKDGNGFIAQVDLDGQIINEKWATELDAPKGMGIYEDKLYVTNITQLVEIELTTGSISNRWEVDGSVFLNDITIDQEGSVYFTDSETNKIHMFKNGEISTWLENSEITGFNGLLAESSGLMLASMGSSNFVRINWDTKAIKVKTDSIGAGDGIASDGNGNYIVSSWSGEVFFINGNSWEKTSILKTQIDKIQSADITYIPEKRLLLVPTFFKNTVAAYEINMK